MYKNFLSIVFVLFVLGELAGCTTSFISPESGPTAKLSERDPLIANVAVYDDSIECKRAHSLYALFSKNKKTFVTIPANKPLTLRVVTHSGYGVEPSFDNVTFIPQAGQKYTVQSIANKNSPRFSHVQILKEVVSKDGKIRYTPTRFIHREGGIFAECKDEQMKQNIKRISTSYHPQ